MGGAIAHQSNKNLHQLIGTGRISDGNSSRGSCSRNRLFPLLKQIKELNPYLNSIADNTNYVKTPLATYLPAGTGVADLLRIGSPTPRRINRF